MRPLGEIIAKNRKAHGMNQAALAAELKKYDIHIKKSAVGSWETGISQPSATQLFAICHLFGITDVYSEFIGVNPNNPLAELNEEGRRKALDYIRLLIRSGEYNITGANLCSKVRERILNIYYLPVSAGTGSFLDQEDYEEVSVGSEVPDSADFGVRVSGDSMEPRFINEQIVWVHKTPDLNSGDIGIFYLNGNAYIKKLQQENGSLRLISLNSKYAPIIIHETDRFQIFGRAVS